MHIEECVNSAATMAIIDVGLSGGRITTEDNVVNITPNPISFHYREAELFIPTAQEYEQAIKQMYHMHFSDCIVNYVDYDPLLPHLALVGIDSDVIIGESFVMIFSHHVVDVELGANVQTFSGGYVNFDSLFIPHLLMVSEQLAEFQKLYPDSYCHSCMAILALDSFVEIELAEIDEFLTFYTIVDLRTQIGERPYALMVAHEH